MGTTSLFRRRSDLKGKVWTPAGACASLPVGFGMQGGSGGVPCGQCRLGHPGVEGYRKGAMPLRKPSFLSGASGFLQ